MGHSASDVERFTYCHLSWWLAHHGAKGMDEAQRRGVEAHAAKGRSVGVLRRLLERYRSGIAIATDLTLFAAVCVILAIDFVYLDLNDALSPYFLTLALVTVLISVAFLLRAFMAITNAREVSQKAGIAPGTLEYSDLDRPGDLLVSKRFELAGKPDYMVRQNGSLIPVEVKTGKTPRQPHDSHILQLAAYCLLTEEVEGVRPPKGIIQYPTAQFEIRYDEPLKDKLLETLLRMRLAEVTGTAHRSHNMPAKCRNCSRRENCPERLA